MPYRYAILMETNGKEYESWYNFIRYEENEEALQYLQKQLSKVDFYILDEYSTFDLELSNLVSEETATEMCKVDLNAYMFHRKFDGTLKKINFDFSKRDDNEDRIEKVYDKIGMGDIDKYIDGEDLINGPYEKRDDEESDEDNESENVSDSDSESEDEKDTKIKHKKK